METLIATQANIAIVQKAFADFGSGNIEDIVRACTPDVKWGSFENDGIPYATMFKGKAGVGEFFKNLAETVDYTAFEPKEFYAIDNKVFAKVYHAATIKATGKSFSHDCFMDFTIEDEKISYFFVYLDTQDQAKAFSN